MLLGIRGSRANIHWYRVGRSSTVCARGGRGASNFTREWTPVQTGRLGGASVIARGAGMGPPRPGGECGGVSVAAGAATFARSRALEGGGVLADAEGETTAAGRGSGGAGGASGAPRTTGPAFGSSACILRSR